MKNVTFSVFWCLTLLVPGPWDCQAQSGFPKYNEFSRLYSKGDSCYTSGNYRMAGEFFYQASLMDIEKGIEVSKGDMFCLTSVAFALAGEMQRAFQYLRIAAFDYGFSNIEVLSDSSFAGIRPSTEWDILEQKVRSNHQHEVARQELFKKRTALDLSSGETVFRPVRSKHLQQVFSLDSLPFISVNHRNFRLYFSADSHAAQHLPEIKSQIDHALDRALALLDTAAYYNGISIVFFNSPQEMKSVTGIKALGGIAYPEDQVAFFPYTKDRRFQFNHEIFHKVSLNVWGTPSCRMLMEGSAVYADNQCHIENPILAINAYYLLNNLLLPIDSLIQHFDLLAQKNDVMTYLQSAGFFKYLYEKYGAERMKVLWTSGFENVQDLFGKNLGRIEEEYREYLKQIPVPSEFQESMIEKGCG